MGWVEVMGDEKKNKKKRQSCLILAAAVSEAKNKIAPGEINIFSHLNIYAVMSPFGIFFRLNRK